MGANGCKRRARVNAAVAYIERNIEKPHVSQVAALSMMSSAHPRHPKRSNHVAQGWLQAPSRIMPQPRRKRGADASTARQAPGTQSQQLAVCGHRTATREWCARYAPDNGQLQSHHLDSHAQWSRRTKRLVNTGKWRRAMCAQSTVVKHCSRRRRLGTTTRRTHPA